MQYENWDKMSSETMDIKRAIESLNEEMEAVNAYNQRANMCSDLELREILIHNANEEKEHAAMILEWLRRKDSNLDHELKDNLFKEGKITGQH